MQGRAARSQDEAEGGEAVEAEQEVPQQEGDLVDACGGVGEDGEDTRDDRERREQAAQVGFQGTGLRRAMASLENLSGCQQLGRSVRTNAPVF